MIFVLRKLFLNLILCLSHSRDSNLLLFWRLIFSSSLFFLGTEQLCFFQYLFVDVLTCACSHDSLLDSLKMHCVFSKIQNGAQYGAASSLEHFPFIPRVLINHFSASWVEAVALLPSKGALHAPMFHTAKVTP